MSQVGHSLMKAKMKESGAALGGEMSGHIFFAHRYLGFDDAIYGAARIAAYLGQLEEPLSAQIDRFPSYVNSPEIRIPCADEHKFQVVSDVSQHFQKHE